LLPILYHHVLQGQSDSDGIVAIALKARKLDTVKYLLDKGFKSPPQDVRNMTYSICNFTHFS